MISSEEAGQASQTSKGGEHPVAAHEQSREYIIPVHEPELTPEARRLEWINILSDTKDNAIKPQSAVHRLRKVPFKLEDAGRELKKCFEPMVISIGPYHHHGNEDLKQGEELKLKLTKQFLIGRVTEDLYNNIFKEIKTLKESYGDQEPMKGHDDETLAQMLFVDGCSVLRYIECYVKNKLDDMEIKCQDVASIHRDLFLLENQLPFRVLELLIEHDHNRSFEGVIEKFIKMNVVPPKIRDRRLLRVFHVPLRRFHDLLWWWLCDRHDCMQQLKQWIQIELGKEEDKQPHLLALLKKRLVGKYSSNAEDKRTSNLEEFSHNTISELTAQGIIRPSPTWPWRYVSFTSFCITGVLRLPPITIDDSSKTKFLNLIAYEMGSDKVDDYEVTSYMRFLDSLIDSAEDAKQLTAAGVLHNFLGNYEKVNKLFTDVGTGLSEMLKEVPTIKRSKLTTYHDIKHRIEEHYNSKMKIWISEVKHNYFSSPWTFLALLAAIVGLVLTFIQAYFAVFPRSNGCTQHTVGKLR